MGSFGTVSTPSFMVMVEPKRMPWPRANSERTAGEKRVNIEAEVFVVRDTFQGIPPSPHPCFISLRVSLFIMILVSAVCHYHDRIIRVNRLT